MSGRQNLMGIGECMVELSPTGDGTLRQSFAGDVLNTLWYARAHAGAETGVQFLSAIGTDPVSGEMLAFIEGGGIDCAWVQRIPE